MGLKNIGIRHDQLRLHAHGSGRLDLLEAAMCIFGAPQLKFVDQGIIIMMELAEGKAF